LSAYRSFIGRTVLLGAKELWKACVPPKVKFFLWLAIHGRLWIAEHRKHHGLQDDGACVLCGELLETTDHLILSCVYAREVWWRALHHIHLQHLVPIADDKLRPWWLWTRALLPSGLSRSFDSLVLLICWNLWKERNSRTFDRTHTWTAALLETIARDADSWVTAGFGVLALLLARTG
jgi:hypothetical protein